MLLLRDLGDFADIVDLTVLLAVGAPLLLGQEAYYSLIACLAAVGRVALLLVRLLGQTLLGRR